MLVHGWVGEGARCILEAQLPNDLPCKENISLSNIMIGQQKRHLEHECSPQPVKYLKPTTKLHDDSIEVVIELHKELPNISSLETWEEYSSKVKDVLVNPTLPSQVASDPRHAKHAATPRLEALGNHNARNFEEYDRAHESLLDLKKSVMGDAEDVHCYSEGFQVPSTCLDHGKPAVHNHVEYRTIKVQDDCSYPNTRTLENNKKQKICMQRKKFEMNEDHVYGCHLKESNAFLDNIKKFREAWKPNGFRPLPVFLAGQEVDLFAMMEKVRELGGYHRVTKGGYWTGIATHMGLRLECGPSLKLVYMKYLKRLESGTLLEFKGQAIESITAKAEQPLTPGLVDAESPVQLQHPSTNKLIKSATTDNVTGIVTGENLGLAVGRRSLGFESIPQDSQNLTNNTSSSIYKSADGSNKDPMFNLLIWVKRLALNPEDPKKGQGPSGSKEDETWVEGCSRLARNMRSLFWKKNQELTNNQLRQRTLQHDKVVRLEQQGLERTGAREHQTRYRLRRFPGVWSSSTHQMSTQEMGSGDGTNVMLHKRIPIGPDFQAVLPPFHVHSKKKGSETGELDDAQNKWLGVTIWLGPEDVSEAGLGKGRSMQCKCIYPKSQECVQLHNREQRKRLKRELGDAFSRLGFDEMGECISEKWTHEEQRAFKKLVKMHPVSLGENFWDYLPKHFSHKNMQELVSYYFNVFVLQRRGVQNRTDLATVNSDDDEGDLPGTDDEYTGSYYFEDENEKRWEKGMRLPQVDLNRSPTFDGM